MIEEAAYYYMGKHPSIGKDNGTGDYTTTGQKMVQTYPSIGRPGAQPWVCLTAAYFTLLFPYLYIIHIDLYSILPDIFIQYILQNLEVLFFLYLQKKQKQY